MPGGKIEFKESAITAANREIREELNIDIDPEFLFFIEDFDSIEDKHVIVFCFSAICNEKVKLKQDEISEVSFFAPDEVEKREDIAFNHKTIMKKYTELL